MLGVDSAARDTQALYVVPHRTERGGVLSLARMNGCDYAIYEPNPNQDTVPLGIQQHDQEETDLFCGSGPWRFGRVFPSHSPFPYMTAGIIVTNAIHPDVDPASIRHGAPAYLAPSGLITSVTTFSSRRLGTFQSILNDTALVVPGGLGPSSLRVGMTESEVDPQPILIPTAGWAKLRINI